MKKMNIVQKNEEFKYIIENGSKKKSGLYYIYYIKNSLNYNRYGIAVSKKIGNAVVRNKNKRQIKSIIDNNNIRLQGYDFVIILKTNINEFSYLQKEGDMLSLLRNIGEIYEK